MVWYGPGIVFQKMAPERVSTSKKHAIKIRKRLRPWLRSLKDLIISVKRASNLLRVRL